jgi:hypothetical protein
MAKIRPISLHGSTKYIVEFGEDFMMFDFLSAAMLYCTIDLDAEYEVAE